VRDARALGPSRRARGVLEQRRVRAGQAREPRGVRRSAHAAGHEHRRECACNRQLRERVCDAVGGHDHAGAGVIEDPGEVRHVAIDGPEGHRRCERQGRAAHRHRAQQRAHEVRRARQENRDRFARPRVLGEARSPASRVEERVARGVAARLASTVERDQRGTVAGALLERLDQRGRWAPQGGGASEDGRRGVHRVHRCASRPPAR
jgi:hypothetical protein